MIDRFYRSFTYAGNKKEAEGYIFFKKFVVINSMFDDSCLKDLILRKNKSEGLATYFVKNKGVASSSSNVIKKIWRGDLYKWESKMKWYSFTYYKYELRDGATVNTSYSIFRK